MEDYHKVYDTVEKIPLEARAEVEAAHPNVEWLLDGVINDSARTFRLLFTESVNDGLTSQHTVVDAVTFEERTFTGQLQRSFMVRLRKEGDRVIALNFNSLCYPFEV